MTHVARSLMGVGLVLVSALSFAPGLAAQTSALPSLQPKDEIKAEIDDGAPPVRSRILDAGYTMAPTVGRRYRLYITASGTYSIDLKSPYFDSYLVLRNGKNEIVAEDDDGLIATHARLIVELDSKEIYELEACALHGQRGDYTLSMRKGEPKPGENIEWTDEEIEVRIQTAFEEDDWKKVDVVKSKRYLIFTNSSAGKKFGKILDKDIYEGFRKEFKFDDPKNIRRLPVYLFGTREDYIAFLVSNVGMTEEAAKQTGGIQYRDYYATTYNSPRDPLHFHECAHQIMSTVLRLGGGGSWFQEGIAEYYQDKIRKFNRFSETRMTMRSDQTLSLRELVESKSMMFSAGENIKGGGGARGMYGQAASVIQFLKEGPRKKQFSAFLDEVGHLPAGNTPMLEEALQRIYGVGIDELGEEWEEYFAG